MVGILENDEDPIVMYRADLDAIPLGSKIAAEAILELFKVVPAPVLET